MVYGMEGAYEIAPTAEELEEWKRYADAAREMGQKPYNIYRWLELGKPLMGAPEGEVGPPKEPWELSEEAGEGPWPISEWSEPPFPVPSGANWLWKIIRADPETGRPIEPSWVMTSAEAEGLEQPTGMLGWNIETMEGRQYWIQRDETGNIIGFEGAGGQEVGLAGDDKYAARLERQLALERELGGLTGPASWIQRWGLEEGAIPQAEASVARARIGNLEDLTFQMMGQAKQMTGQSRIDIEKEIDKNLAKVEKLEERERGISERGRGGTPPAPQWLSQFAPGQTAGQPITKEQIRTPSGQQWARTPWSQREGLRGYAEYAGGRPLTDIMEHMAMMQPETPRGAGYQRWMPMRQR